MTCDGLWLALPIFATSPGKSSTQRSEWFKSSLTRFHRKISQGPTHVSLPRLLTSISAGMPWRQSTWGLSLHATWGTMSWASVPRLSGRLWTSLDPGHPTFWTSPLPKILPRDGMTTANSNGQLPAVDRFYCISWCILPLQLQAFWCSMLKNSWRMSKVFKLLKMCQDVSKASCARGPRHIGCIGWSPSAADQADAEASYAEGSHAAGLYRSCCMLWPWICWCVWLYDSWPDVHL